jgi:hypothetical protein
LGHIGVRLREEELLLKDRNMQEYRERLRAV